jgi:membrane protease YdiL (CAAX protease family)
MSFIPPPEVRRKVGSGPSPYFSSVLGLFGGILAWLTASALLLGYCLKPLLGEPAADGSWTAEQMDAAQRALAAQPWGPLVFVAPLFAFVLVACVLAFLSRASFVNRLALHPLRMPGSTLLLLCCGMLGVQALVVSLSPLLGRPSDQLQFLNEVVSEPEGGRALFVALLVSLVPAFCEELFFRGFVQSRLSALWPPGLAIFLTATIFALTHIDLQHVIAVLPIGLYLGWAAWRSGTVWTAMLLHALNNLAAVGLARLPGGEFPAWPVWAATLVLGLLGYQGAKRLLDSPAADETARLSLEGLQ